MEKKFIGIIGLTDTVDITDPCYDKDTWCRINDVKIVPGRYWCYVWEETEEDPYSGNTYKVNSSIAIYKDDIEPNQLKMKNIGWIGVDAGMAGFFENKPDYTQKQWGNFVDSLHLGHGCKEWIVDSNFFADVAYGDGSYPVKAHLTEDGRADALEIVCMC